VATENDIGTLTVEKTLSASVAMADTLLKKIPGVGGALSKFGSSLTAVKEILDAQSVTWQQMSGLGASFNNSILQMSASASSARLLLSELSTIVQKNSDVFIGLSGNVTDGALAFSRVSKAMFEFSDNTGSVTDRLRAFGWSNTELNDLLVLQLANYKGSAKTEKQITEESIKSTAKLASEMDLLAKLTGVSRKEQMEKMQKERTDMVAEARVREIAMRTGQDVDKVRALYQQQLNEATLSGVGQIFKEQFAYGNVISKEAAEQQALIGSKASTALIEQVKATTNGREEEAKAASERVAGALVDVFKSPTFLSIVKFHEGAQQVFLAGQARDAAITKFILDKSTPEKPMTSEAALKELINNARKSQQMQDEVTKVLLSFQNLKLTMADAINKGVASMAGSAEVQKAAADLRSMLAGGNQFLIQAQKLIPAVGDRLVKIAEFSQTGNESARKQEEAALRKDVKTSLDAMKATDEERATANKYLNTLLTNMAAGPSAETDNTGAQVGKVFSDFFKSDSPFFTKLCELPGQIASAITNSLSQWGTAKINETVSKTLFPPFKAGVVPKGLSSGGMMSPGESYGLNVQGVPQLLHKEHDSGPEWVYNRDQVNNMDAHFGRSRLQNRKLLDMQNDVAASSRQANVSFLSKLTSLSSQLTQAQPADPNPSQYQFEINPDMSQWINKLPLDSISATMSSATASLGKIAEHTKQDPKKKLDEPAPVKNYDLTLTSSGSPKTVEVAKRISDDRAKEENERKLKAAEAAATAKNLQKSEEEKPDKAHHVKKVDLASKKSEETLTAILLQIERLNTQTRELINQESKNAVNLITATKRSQGYV
jgi:hypothetical protein